MNQESALVTVRLTGSDAGDFLQGYVTCDTSLTSSKAASPMSFPDRQGRVVANGWMYGSSEDIALAIHSSTVEILKSHLKLYLQFSKSSFDSNIQPCGVHGSVGNSGITIEGLQASLVDEAQTEKECFGVLVDLNQPLVTSTTSGKYLPQMLNLERSGAISFDKGCYLGQEVIARAQHRGQVKRRMQRFAVRKGHVQTGDTVVDHLSQRGEVVLASSTHALIVTASSAEQVSNESAELELAA